MSTSPPNLITKLFIPPVRPAIVARPRLLARLSEGLARSLTLLSAPAGSGKTTLLGEWRASDSGRAFPLAWLSLDEDDNDPIRFGTYLLAALRKVAGEAVDPVESLLLAPQPQPLKILAAALAEPLATWPAPFALVLDDYHIITTHSIHEALLYLLEHLPPPMHLVILTRADPPLPLARLRARNQLTEIRAADLRFMPDETAAFFKQVIDVTLSPDDVRALDQRTEGWIAGLQLAALSVQGRDAQAASDFIAAFTGSHHYIADYLTEEVLNRQPEAVKSFLLKTSVLERMTGPLCDALLDRADGQATLETLEQGNLFVVPLDDERRWYRYHHLFDDMLYSRLRQQHADQLPELNRRAAAWLERNGQLDEAVCYALEAREFEYAAQLLEQIIPTISMQSRIRMLSARINPLPETVIAAHPRLGLAQAWVFFFERRFERVETRLQQVEARLTPDTSPGMAGELALLRGALARIHFDMDESLACLQRALETLPGDDHLMRARAGILIGTVYQMRLRNEWPQAQAAFQKALELSEAVGNFNGLLAALYCLAQTHLMRGALRHSEAACRRALHLAEQVPNWPVAHYAHLGMAEVQCEWNDLECAAGHVHRAIALAEAGGNQDYRLSALLIAARIDRARGDWRSAQTRLDQAETLAPEADQLAQAQLDDEQTRLWLAQGRLGEASRRILESGPPAGAARNLPEALRQLIWARVAIRQRPAPNVLPLLQQWLERAEAAGMGGLTLQTLALQALALETGGQTEPALRALTRALSLGEVEGHIRAFVDEGPPMAALLRRAGSRGIAPPYVARLLAAFDFSPGENPAARQPLLEPLSERELEVLQLLMAGKSNEDIAAELVLAIGTVKKHLSNIFGKLSVESRTQCVARARELRLV